MADAVVHRPGEGERHQAGGNNAVIIKAGSAETNGSLFVSEVRIDPGFPVPPALRHERLHDMFSTSTRQGGWENYIRELGEAAKAGPLAQEVMGRIAPKYDFEAV